jgi:hypothetical protein
MLTRSPAWLFRLSAGCKHRTRKVDFTSVDEDMRVGVGRDRQLPLPDEPGDFGERPA